MRRAASPARFSVGKGHQSEDAILTCRLIDRPLRPSFMKGLRNEVQIVETLLSLHPEHLYNVVAINAASMSTMLTGPAVFGSDRRRPGRSRSRGSGWRSRPYSQLGEATFDMVVAGRLWLDDGDVAIMMVKAKATSEHPHG